MTLEEIKHDLWSFADREVIAFLIAEVGRLKAENVNYETAWVKTVSGRCAEIAGETSKLAQHRINIEFGMVG